MSIRQRLPLLICTLLLCIIISFSFLSYYGIRRSEINMGSERLQSVTQQLGAILSQSTNTLVANLAKSATTVNTLDEMKALRKDSTMVLAELTNRDLQTILSYSENDSALQIRLAAIKKTWKNIGKFNNGLVGNIYFIDGSLYAPVIAPVTDKAGIQGYLITWNLLYTAPSAIERLSQLIGKGANFYIGNEDGSLWTDLVKPVSPPNTAYPFSGKDLSYKNAKGESVIAKAQRVSNSTWYVLAELSESTITEGATRLLKWIIMIGTILLIAGIFITRYMTRSITEPLYQLTNAATAMSKGDREQQVDVKGNDELGKLAIAFNLMSKEVNASHTVLEQKVAERTAELENANKELESFSYTVSHDLRAPLRGIIGFSTLLEEKYGKQMDDEAKRLTGIIKKNTLRMGNLIDDLLAFSKIGRDEMKKGPINSDAMVHDVIENLVPKNAQSDIEWKIAGLRQVVGDAKAIQQVWTNLISNAIKYSGRKEHPIIEIGSFIDDDQTAFFVRDNGVGFDPQYKDKLFKVFQRLHSMAEFEGTGIGLAIVEKIVSKHGGRAWVEAKEHEGATFYFSLP